VVASPVVRRDRSHQLDGEPIRVLRVIARLNVGGPALHVTYLSSELDRLGYDTTLAAGTVSVGEGSMEQIARSRGVDPIVIRGLQREIQFLSDIKVAWRLRRLIRSTRPHVLHTHTAKAGAVARIAAMLAGDARPPVLVHTFHGHVLRGYFGPIRTWIFKVLERRLASFSDALVAVSPQVRDELADLGVAPAARIAVVRLGLDLDDRAAATPNARILFRRSLGISDEQFAVGWLGRMTEIKRVDHLLRAFARLDADAVLILAGDGPLRPVLELLARDLGIARRCFFIGYVADVGSIYHAVDVVALTSANEGTPVTLIEASAARRPVVSTDVGGVADVVSHGETGYLVPPDDVAGLANRLTELAEDPSLRTRLGMAGCEHVRNRYSVPRLVGDIDRLYSSLLAVRAPSERRTLTQLNRPLVPTLTTPSQRGSRAKRPLRIVLVSQYFPPEVGATQSRMQAFAEHLHAQGHSVTVISEFPSHPRGIIPPRYGGRLIEDDRSNGYRTLRVWVKTSPEKTQTTRIALYLSFMGMAAAVAPLAGRCDVVVATSPPLFVGAAGLAIARASRAPLVLDIRDLWPDAALSLQQISSGATMRAAVELEHFLYRHADAVTAVTKPFCRHIDSIRGGPATVLLPNGTLDLFFHTSFDPAARRELRGTPERFLATFAGTHGIAQALPSVLDAAELVEDFADFAFVGDGPAKDMLEHEVEQRRLSNVSFHPQVPLEAIPRLLAASDALLVPLSGHPVFAEFVPSKLIDFMAIGKPILLSARGEAARILELAGAGVAIPPEDPVALADAMRQVAVNPTAAAKMGRRGRDFASQRLRSVQAERLEQLLLDLALLSGKK
jgi:glycosyltransferase involved in cell wall biosynthesis